jgi:hypothetical protein
MTRVKKAALALTGRQLTVTAVTQRAPGLYLGASAQARRHRELSAQALTPVLAEGRVRQLQEAAGPTLYRHLVVSGAPPGVTQLAPAFTAVLPADPGPPPRWSRARVRVSRRSLGGAGCGTRRGESGARSQLCRPGRRRADRWPGGGPGRPSGRLRPGPLPPRQEK